MPPTSHYSARRSALEAMHDGHATRGLRDDAGVINADFGRHAADIVEHASHAGCMHA